MQGSDLEASEGAAWWDHGCKSQGRCKASSHPEKKKTLNEERLLEKPCSLDKKKELQIKIDAKKNSILNKIKENKKPTDIVKNDIKEKDSDNIENIKVTDIVKTIHNPETGKMILKKKIWKI